MAVDSEPKKVTTSVFTRAVRNIRKKPKKDFFKIEGAERSKKLENSLRKQRQKSPSRKGKRGIVYLSHIPPGFFEAEMKKYFSQFGTVTRIKLARSKKTGKSKGHAYVEFLYLEVAQIVAETMNNYLMCNRLLKAQLLNKRFPKTFWTQFQGKLCRKARRSKAHVKKLNTRHLKGEKAEKFVAKKVSKLKALSKKLKLKGIDFDYKPEFADIDTKISGVGKFRVSDENKPSDEIMQRNDERPVLEVDESDNEIEFKTPPNAVKRKLKSNKIDSMSWKPTSKKRYFDISKDNLDTTFSIANEAGMNIKNNEDKNILHKKKKNNSLLLGGMPQSNIGGVKEISVLKSKKMKKITGKKKET